MTLIDDYSRFTFIFLLRNKFQVKDLMKDCIKYSCTQFGRKPSFRPDLGTEYFNEELNNHLKGQGIILKTHSSLHI